MTILCQQRSKLRRKEVEVPLLRGGSAQLSLCVQIEDGGQLHPKPPPLRSAAYFEPQRTPLTDGVLLVQVDQSRRLQKLDPNIAHQPRPIARGQLGYRITAGGLAAFRRLFLKDPSSQARSGTSVAMLLLKRGCDSCFHIVSIRAFLSMSI